MNSLGINLDSPLIIWLAIVYGILSSITTLDQRLNQARKRGLLEHGESKLPPWVDLIHFIEWGTFIVILILNWRFGLLVYVVKFFLKVLPVLETIGNIIMSPFKEK